MSKAIRIAEHLYEEIERLAAEGRRSLTAQLELLLEQALRMDAPKGRSIRTGELTDADAQPRDVQARTVQASEAADATTSSPPRGAQRPVPRVSASEDVQPDFKPGGKKR